MFLLTIISTPAWAGFSGKDLPSGKASVTPVAVNDNIIAKLKTPHGNAASVSATLRANGLQVARELRSVPGLRVLRTTGNARSAVARQQGLKQRMARLMESGLFEYVEPDWQISVQALPTDKSFSNGDLWGLRNTGQNGGVTGIDVNAVPAWDTTTGSPTVIVAVIDTGIRYSHTDLSGNMWSNSAEIPSNGVDDDSNGYIDDIHGINAITGSGDPMDDHDHGTHVAGTIAATAFDSGAHVGVAYNVKLMALKCLDSDGYGTVSGAIACIDYAIENGANIMNNSWGGTGFSQALKDAVEAAGSAGVLFVAAAGNSGSDNEFVPFYPASFDLSNVLSVAAIDRTGDLASFSNFGSASVDLGAPGVDILSSTSGSDSSYAYFNGTSMATPHVAGVAALVASEYPAADLFELRTRLTQSVTPLASLNGKTVSGGMVNAEAALLLSEDGDMEFRVNTANGALVGDEMNIITIFLTDLVPLTGASVSASIDGGSTYTPFLDDGTVPDLEADDAIYTASLLVPSGTSTIDVEVSATAPGKNPSSDIVTFRIVSPPPNDDFSDREILSNSVSTATGTNVDATFELSEPIYPATAGGHSVWYEWTPTVSGSVSVSTSGSSFDTTLAIYQGTALDGLTLVGENDDRVGLQSAITFTATAYQTYLIQVNGYAPATGDILLSYGQFSVGVPNDDFANRILLEAGTTQTTGSNAGATFETFEPRIPSTADFYSVWWEWIAPSSDPAIIDTSGSGYDTTLAVYQGTELQNLVLIAENDDESYPTINTSLVSFTPVAGQSYMIQVNGFFGESGNIVLNYPDPAPPSVPNDNFAQRIVLEHGTTQTAGSNDGASLETSEPVNPVTAGNVSVWWEWNSGVSGTVVIDTYGSSYDTTLAVYTGNELGTLVLTGADDDTSGTQSEVTFLATQGTSYIIQVNGSGGDSGDIKLNYPEPAAPSPLNDNLGDRIVLPLGTTQASGSNESATLEATEPQNPFGSGSNSVWWEWIAPSTTPATITTIGSGFDTTLAVYTGTDFTNLLLVADNNDDSGQQSSVTFTPVAGQPYLIQVNGHGTAYGSIVLNYPLPGIPRPLNDNFSNRISFEPGTIRTSGTNEGATTETSEVPHPSTAGTHSVWWEWKAPSSGPVTIDTFDSTFDTTLAIYTGSDLGSLSLVGENDDFIGVHSAVSFSATAGVSYMIQVNGFDTESGVIYLNYPMPFPVAVHPGSIRLSGSPGGNASSILTISNGDTIPVDFSVSSPAGWITPVPDSGSLSAGSEISIALNLNPLPEFLDAVYADVTIGLGHPSIPSISIPIEIVDDSLVVDIPDVNLRRVIEQHLGRLPDEPLVNIELAILTSLDARERNIQSLVGLEYAINLFYLYLTDNQISDLSPLSGLTSLFILDLNNNNLSEISVLEGLPILFDVDVRLNYLDINPGSDDRSVIDSIAARASIEYDPQKGGMITLADWITLWGVPAGMDGPENSNGPLAIPNILAFMMGLDPFTATASDLPVANRIPGTDLFTFTYHRDLNVLGILTSHLKSSDMSTWNLAIPLQINVLADDGNGHQLVEAVFEEASDRMFFILETNPY